MTSPGELSLSLSGGFLVTALMAVAIILAWYAYRNTTPRLSSSRRWPLTALRALALAVLVLLLAEPALRFDYTETTPPGVAILMDNTKSLTVIGADSARARNGFLPDDFAATVAAANLYYMPFAGSVLSIGQDRPDTLSLEGESTNLSAALTELRARKQELNIQAVVLGTDGNYNEGRNPLHELDGLDVPIFVVGLGDTLQRKDVVLAGVTANSIAYAGSLLPVEATIRHSGYEGRKAEAAISRGGEVVSRRTVTLAAGGSESTVRFSVPLDAEGMQRFTVSVAPLQGELTAANNRHSFFVRVLRSRLRVIVVSGAPTPDVAAIRQAVAEDPQLSVESFSERAGGRLHGGDFRKAIDSADCVVTINFPTVSSDPEHVRMIAAAAARKVPLFYLHGRGVDVRKLGPLEEHLPVSIGSPNLAEDFVFPAIAARSAAHPLVTMNDGAVTPATWERLPPLFRLRTPIKPKPGSEMLVAARLQNVQLDEPLIVVRSRAGAKSLAVAGHGIYRWRLTAQGSEVTTGFFPIFVSNAVRWLTTRGDERSVRVRPVKEVFTSSDEVAFTAEVYDEQLRPVPDAEVVVEFSEGGTKRRGALAPRGNGRYQGSFSRPAPGEYSFSASASSGGRTLGSDGGKFSVGELNLEYLATSMNKELLEQLAFQSGGRFAAAAEAGEMLAGIPQHVELSDRTRSIREEIELWNWPWLAAAAIFLFGIEWFFRKRWNLL